MNKVQLSKMATGEVVLQITLHTAIVKFVPWLDVLATRIIAKVEQLAEQPPNLALQRTLGAGFCDAKPET